MEFEFDKVNRHRIEANNILAEKVTGRVVAVFYNDYDLDEIAQLQKQNVDMKEAFKKMENISFGCDGDCGVIAIIDSLDL